jgi:hypothetical protein
MKKTKTKTKSQGRTKTPAPGKKRRSRRGGEARGQGSSPAEGLSGRKASSGDWLWACALTLLAFLHRIFFLFSNSDRALPFSGFYHGDAEPFFRHARAILEGWEYDSGIPFHPPGFPYLLAGIQNLLGAGAAGSSVPHLSVKVVLALLSSLAVGLLYLLARPYLGRAMAVLGAAFCLYHFGLYVLAVSPVGEGVSLSLLLLALLVWSRGLAHPLAAVSGAAACDQDQAGRGSLLWGWVCGALLGLLALFRAEMLLLAVALWAVGIFGVLRTKGAGPVSLRRLSPWLLLLVGLGMALLPWTLRNGRTLSAYNEKEGAFLEEPLPTVVPITLYGPINLALANHAQANGTFSRDLLSSQMQSGKLSFRDPQHLRFFLHGDEMAWQFIRSEPLAWGKLVLRKWRLGLDAARLGWSQWDWPGGLRGVRRPVDIFVPYSQAAQWWILPGALLGFLACCASPGGERRWALLVALVTACNLLVMAFFFGYARLMLLILPFWLVMLAVALIKLGALLRRRWTQGAAIPERRWLRWAGAAALILFLLEAWGATQDRRYQAAGTTLAGRTTLNPDLTVTLRPLP